MVVTGHVYFSAWDWHPSVVVGCLALLLGYGIVLRFRLTAHAWWWAAGVLTLLLALVSPLDGLGDSYLFSAHMLQHLTLTLLVPPLLLLGIPAQPLRRFLKKQPWLSRLERVLTQPVVAWVLAVGVMWVWHIPALYDATLQSETIHVGEHFCFLVTATIFWWPILTPLPERRCRNLPGMLYLVAASITNAVLGILLTFAPPDFYPSYVNPVDRLGILNQIKLDGGLSRVFDQQLGGMFMWVLGALGYLFGVFVLMARMYSQSVAESYARAMHEELNIEVETEAPAEQEVALKNPEFRAPNSELQGT